MTARITKITRIENGPTTGEIVYIDEHGTRWVKTPLSRESCGTGERIGTMIGNEIYE